MIADAPGQAAADRTSAGCVREPLPQPAPVGRLFFQCRKLLRVAWCDVTEEVIGGGLFAVETHQKPAFSLDENEPFGLQSMRTCLTSDVLKRKA